MAANRSPCSALFVGALALEGLPAALASGADLVCIDLEDPVPAQRKEEARAAVLATLPSVKVPAAVQLIVRVNKLRSMTGVEDVVAMLRAPNVGGLMLPMVQGADEVRWVGALAEDVGSAAQLYPIIETTSGLERARLIAATHARVKALFFGANDLSAALGCANEWEALLYARSRTVHGAISAGIGVLDAPHAGADDLTGLRTACERARALGMVGKAAKHASHVSTIRAVFAIS